MWFFIASTSFLLSLWCFIYVVGTMTSVERPSFFLKCYVELIAIATFVLFGFSIVALWKFILDIVKLFV